MIRTRIFGVLIFCALNAGAVDRIANTYPPVIQGLARAVAIDANGNRYVTGSYTSGLDFNPGVGIDAKPDAGGTEIFVTRFNADGSYAWTQSFNGTGEDVANGITCSATAVYITGTFTSTDGGIGGTGTFSRISGNDVLVMALNLADGSPLATFGTGGLQKFGGSTLAGGGATAEEGLRIAVAGTLVYVAGTFSTTNAGIGGIGTITTLGNSDAFVLALDATTGAAFTNFGNRGVQRFGGTGTDRGGGLVIVNGRIYLSGSFLSSAGVNGATGVTSAGVSDVFVCALSIVNGSAIASFGTNGSQSFGGNSNDYGRDLALLGSTLYACGEFQSAAPRIGGLPTVGATGANDSFVFAVNATSGAPVTTFGFNGFQKFGGSSDDFCASIAASGQGVYVAGYFTSINFGIGGAGGFVPLGGEDAYCVGLNAATGTPLGAFGNSGFYQFGGTNGVDRANSVAVSNSTVFFAGNFYSSDASLNGVGNFDATNFNGFLETLNVADATVAVPAITWAAPADIALGTPLSTIQHNATADVPGTFAYQPATGTLLPLGFNQTLFATFTPENVLAYEVVIVSVQINVLPADAVANTYPPLVKGNVAAVAVDRFGNRYVTGSFTDALSDFCPHAGVDSKRIVLGEDVFVTRFNADGSYAWTQTFGGMGTDRGLFIAVSGTTVFVAGNFNSNNAGFGGAAGSFATAGQDDAFVIALNADTGIPVATFGTNGLQKFGGTNADRTNGMTVANGVVYLSGEFTGANAGIGGVGTYASTGNSDGFLLALNANDGQAKSGFASGGVQRFCGTTAQRGRAVAESGGVLYWVGDTAGSNGGLGALGTFTSAGSSDVFIAALNAETGAGVPGFGNASGLQRFGGTSADLPTGVVVLDSTVYVCGYFSSTNGASIGGLGTISSKGSEDAFVLALNSTTGEPVQSFGTTGGMTFGGTGADRANSMCVTESQLYVAGNFASANAGFYASGGYASAGNSDAYIFSLNPATGGVFTSFGNSGLQTFSGAAADNGLSVAVYGSTVLVSGNFLSTNAGIGGLGSYSFSAGFTGILLPLNSADGTFMVPTTETHVNVPDMAVAYSVADQPIVFSAHMTVAANLVTDGIVDIQIKDGETLVGAMASGNVLNGVAEITYILPGGTPLGSYTIEAAYAGPTFPSSFSNEHVLRVVQPGMLTAQNAAAVYHTLSFPVLLHATLTEINGPVNEGTGSFQIKSGNTVLATSPAVPVLNNEINSFCDVPAATGAGEYTIVATFSGSANFAPNSDTTKLLTITRAPAVLTANNAVSAHSVNDKPVTLTASLNSDTGVVGGGTVTFQLKSGAQNVGAAVSGTLLNQICTVSYTIPGGTTVGSYTIEAVFSGSANFLDCSDTAHVVTIGKGIPEVEWPEPAAIFYATPLGAEQLNATAPGVAGVFVYDQAAGTILQSGDNQLLSATFFPADTTQFDTAKATTLLDVLKAPLPVVAENKTRAVGGANPPLTWNISGFVNNDAPTVVTGAPVLQTPAGAASPAGNYPIIVANGTLTAANYDFELVNGTLNVTKLLEFSNLSEPVITYGQTPTLLSGNITFGTSGAVIVTIEGVSGSATIVENGRFDAVVTTSLLDIGTHTIHYDYPGNADLLPCSALRQITVVKRTPSIAWPNPASIEFGTALSAAQLNASATVAGTFAYTPAAGAQLPVGMHPLSVQFTPNDGVRYTSVSASATLAVRKAVPAIVWPDPAEIVFGAALSAKQLNASCSVAGTFAYDPPAGTILHAGIARTLSVQFTPDNTANYEPASAAAYIDVLKAQQQITLAPIPDQELGAPPLTLNASASSGLPVELTCISSAAELAGNILTFNAVGPVVIRVEQSGDDDFEAAPPIENIFNVVILPPLISNALIAGGTQNQTFSFALTAAGTAPLSWSASHLPPGLVFNAAGPDISGTPTSSGAFQTIVTASNPAGSDSKIVTFVFASAAGGENHGPRFVSRATAQPNPAAVNQTVAFSASATDADGDALVFVWDFGDGATGFGSNAEHKYAAAGIYGARVTVSDGVASDYFNLAVVINESSIPPEVYAQYTVAKLALKFNFAKPNADSLSISGTLPLPAAFAPAGAIVAFRSGSVARTFTLDKKGASAGFKLSGKLAKDGTFAASPAKFSLALKKQNLFTGLEELGYQNANTAKGTVIMTPVVITVRDTRYLVTVPVAYSAKQGKSGSGKK